MTDKKNFLVLWDQVNNMSTENKRKRSTRRERKKSPLEISLPEHVITREYIKTGKPGRPRVKDRSLVNSKPQTANPELKGLTEEQLMQRWPNSTPAFIRMQWTRINEQHKHKPQPIDDYPARTVMIKNEQRRYVKGALKQMSKISKHLNTQKFIEYFNEHIGVELIGETLVNVLINDDERTENKLKAVSEINKYAMIPSQAQEIKHEVDDSFGKSEREELQELLAMVRKDTGTSIARLNPYKGETEGDKPEEGEDNE